MPIAFGKILAAFMVMALFFAVQSLAAIQALARFHIPQEKLFIPISAYFIAIVVSALLARLLHQRLSVGSHHTALRIFLFLLFLLPCASQLFGRQLFGDWWHTLFMPAFMGFYLPAAFYLFYHYVPIRQRGLLLALAMAVAEFNWLIIMPVLSGGFASIPEREILAHIENIKNILQIGLGVLLALGFVSLSSLPAGHSGRQPPPDTRRATIPLLIMGACLYVLYGLVSSAGFPKLAPSLSIPLHFSFLVMLPVVGLVLDRMQLKGAVYMLWVTAGLLLACLLLTGLPGEQSKEVTQIVLPSVRHGFLLLSLLLAVYLNKRYFLFWFCVFYLLQGLAMFSAAVGGAINQPVLQLAFAGILLAVFVFLIRRFTSAALSFQENEVETVSPEPKAMPDDPATRLQAFAQTFNLAPKERLVMTGVLDGLSLEAIGGNMDRSVYTVKLHLRRLLKKTGTNNREDLASFYRRWGNAGS